MTSPVGGYTKLAFYDSFSGTSLSPRWARSWFHQSKMNDSVTLESNVRVANGTLLLKQSAPGKGALVNTNPDDASSNPFEFREGYAEARIYFPRVNGRVANWPAFWTNGQDWPATGEHDIAEGLSGGVNANYHYQSGDAHQSKSSGVIKGFNPPVGWHSYGVHRYAGRAAYYYDSVKVWEHETYDGLAPHYLIFNVGDGEYGGPLLYGPTSEVRVNWVRVWTP